MRPITHPDILVPEAVLAILLLVHEVQGQACQLAQLPRCEQLSDCIVLEDPRKSDDQVLRDPKRYITCTQTRSFQLLTQIVQNRLIYKLFKIYLCTFSNEAVYNRGQYSA